jgi:hypothetical protein
MRSGFVEGVTASTAPKDGAIVEATNRFMINGGARAPGD